MLVQHFEVLRVVIEVIFSHVKFLHLARGTTEYLVLEILSDLRIVVLKEARDFVEKLEFVPSYFLTPKLLRLLVEPRDSAIELRQHHTLVVSLVRVDDGDHVDVV